MRPSGQEEWPAWWDWELEMTPHVERRMEDRDFSEVDLLRSMLQRATSLKENVVEGWWVAASRHRGGPWEVTLEPDPDERVIVVITPYGGPMSRHYLEVTYRKGTPVAAYLYLPRPPGAKSFRSERHGEGLVLDFMRDGTLIGVEITALSLVTTQSINEILTSVGVASIEEDDLKPIRAA